jgi:hypothetical protein
MAAVLLVAGLAGCDGGSPDPGSSPSPAPASVASVSPASASSPTPSPSPSGLVRAADDPDWTADQLAAVQALDAYEEVMEKMWNDPTRADFRELVQVSGDPEYTELSNIIMAMAQTNSSMVGGITPVLRVVGAERLVEGRPEIVVRQCQEDDPGGYVIDNGVERPVSGNPRAEYEYVVQWNEGVGAWLVVLVTMTSESC